MRKRFTIFWCCLFFIAAFTSTGQSQYLIFNDNFESGTPHESWGLYRAGEEAVTAVAMNTVPVILEQGGSYAGLAHDSNASYNGAAIILAGATSLRNYSIEGDVYCYVNHPGGSAYTGLVVYADSAAGTYIKLVADFDGDKRLRLYNNHLDVQTFKYTFDYNFNGAAVPSGIPTLDGWHRMKVEVETIDEATTAFWCYFDGELLGGCPILDTSVHQMDAGQFGLYAFQMDTDGIAGYFDNIVVKQYESVPTSVQPKSLTESQNKPTNFTLSQNYPNPFNPETNIAFQINNPEFVELTIYDLLGRKIKNLISEQKAPGSYLVSWNGRDEYESKVPSGVYMYTLKTGSFTATKKMILMK